MGSRLFLGPLWCPTRGPDLKAMPLSKSCTAHSKTSLLGSGLSPCSSAPLASIRQAQNIGDALLNPIACTSTSYVAGIFSSRHAGNHPPSTFPTKLHLGRPHRGRLLDSEMLKRYAGQRPSTLSFSLAITGRVDRVESLPIQSRFQHRRVFSDDFGVRVYSRVSWGARKSYWRIGARYF